jgi:hypothetical protein
VDTAVHNSGVGTRVRIVEGADMLQAWSIEVRERLWDARGAHVCSLEELQDVSVISIPGGRVSLDTHEGSILPAAEEDRYLCTNLVGGMTWPV